MEQWRPRRLLGDLSHLALLPLQARWSRASKWQLLPFPCLPGHRILAHPGHDITQHTKLRVPSVVSHPRSKIDLSTHVFHQYRFTEIGLFALGLVSIGAVQSFVQVHRSSADLFDIQIEANVPWYPLPRAYFDSQPRRSPCRLGPIWKRHVLPAVYTMAPTIAQDQQ